MTHKQLKIIVNSLLSRVQVLEGRQPLGMGYDLDVEESDKQIKTILDKLR